MNAILFSKEPLFGYTIYVAPMAPCARCAAHIIQAGIKRVVYPYFEIPERWEKSMKHTRDMFEEAKIDISIILDSW